MEKLHTSVGVNKFVRRQVKGSGKTYTEGFSFKDIAQHAQKQLANAKYKIGYRRGVVLVEVDHCLLHHFICTFVKIDDNTKLKAEVVRRRPEEEPYIRIRTLNGIPLTTGSVDIILYHHDILLETNEETTNDEWELISFHAIPEGVKYMPMGPVTMMRNQLQLRGGTKAYYKSEEWANSVEFWQEYAMMETHPINI